MRKILLAITGINDILKYKKLLSYFRICHSVTVFTIFLMQS